jgi:type I restriction enzyme S subunit
MIYDLPVEKSVRPSDWTVETVARLADVVGGGTPDTSNPDYWNPPEIPWVTPSDITSCVGSVLMRSERAISVAGLHESSATMLPKNTTLLTSRATIGECRLAGLPVATNQGFTSLVPKDGVDPQFLYCLAQSLKAVLTRLAAGTTFIEVSRREVRRIKVCVPRSPEERALLGQIFAACDAALACSRTRVLAAHRLKISLMQQLFTKGIPGRHTDFQAARALRHEFQTPRSWAVEPLGRSLVLVEYGTNAPSNDEHIGLPLVAIPEVITSRFRLGECSYAELPESEAEALRLAKDDVLLVRTNGNSEYIGKSTVVGEEADSQHIVFASYLIRVRTDEDILMGRYLNYFLASPLGRRLCLAMANTSAGNHNLGARSIRQFCFPRPFPDEQCEIVRIIDAAEDALEAAEAECKCLERLRIGMSQGLLTGRVRVGA